MSNLTEERWQRLQSLYWEALELDEASRASFVDQATSSDTELRRELAGMLAQSASAGKKIGQAIAGMAQSASPNSVWTGRRFGPYQVLREIGRGGMGLVFEARRDDAEFRQTVALKVAPEWRDDALLHERIRHERQILAGLQHPNIARLLDGGTADGVPYFAMEFVEGRRITDYAREQSLSLRDRIVLFRQVLSAVHCAHENLIVHRDLKPSNILVTANGVPKLLDFGIAKLTSSAPDSTTTRMMWTPEYTSPEQVRGKAITVRTDVYSLGLVLYELLCGDRGQVPDTSSPLALDRSICEAEQPVPSARALARGDRALARQLDGDLDRIVSMAIRKEPERRYGSAADFSDDLRRYLDGLPVRAQSGSFHYRALKYVRRHRGVVAAGILLTASIAAGMIATVHEKRRAERRFQQVRNLANAFVFDVHDRILPLPGSTEARKVVVQTALKYLENLREEAGGDSALSRELAAAYAKIGDVQGYPSGSNLGDRAGALTSYQRAESLLQSLVAGGDREARLPLAWAYYKLGTVEREQGNTQVALDRFRQTRKILDPLVKELPDDTAVLSAAAELYSSMSRALFAVRDPSTVETAQASMEVAQKLAALDPASKDKRLLLSAAYSSLALAHLSSNDVEAAALDFTKTVGLREQLVAEEPTQAGYRRDLMIGYGNLGDTLGARTGENLGDTAGAETAFLKALELAEWLTHNDPADQKAIFDVASAQLRVGAILVDTGRVKDGLLRLHSAKRNLSALIQKEPGNYRYRYNAAFVDRRIAEALDLQGHHQEGIRMLEASLAESQKLRNGPESVQVRLQEVLASVRLAIWYSETKNPAALRLAGTVVNDLSQSPTPRLGAWVEASLHGDLSRVYRRMGQSEQAAKELETSRRLWKSLRVPKALEDRRKKELASLDSEFASNRK